MRYYRKATTRELTASTGERRFGHFLKRNPLLVVKAFNTGNHTILVCPEFRFGNRFRADFVVLSAHSGGCELHLLELKSVGARIFLDDGTESEPLRRARKQVLDWHRYIESHQHDFREELSRSVVDRNVFHGRNNYMKRHIEPKIRDLDFGIRLLYHIVIGRRASQSEDDIKRRSFYHKQTYFEIHTYDRFLDQAILLDEAQRDRERFKKEWKAKHPG